MRIIGGKWRSRRLLRPPSTITRPMPDRLKEVIFAMLGNYYDCPGELPGLHVADVFSGSGSLGLEALSRGASTCYFFERDRKVLEVLKKNIKTLEAEDSSTIDVGNAFQGAVADHQGNPFDLIFLDPPYRESMDATINGKVNRYLQSLIAKENHQTLVVFHYSRKIKYLFDDDARWNIVDHRSVGTSAITVLSA